ncbi:hypothetical protein BWD10_01545 [Neisseria zoodegmatis]|uniref:Uncharacterized protein n=1 Tax=Neisseria zoodegmatis TaxID=326523 RepID=A0ABX3WG60_9NEIS|nr:hypothetical protein BWD10_01545 [Neisseria zoodegmatis]
MSNLIPTANIITPAIIHSRTARTAHSCISFQKNKKLWTPAADSIPVYNKTAVFSTSQQPCVE